MTMSLLSITFVVSWSHGADIEHRTIRKGRCEDVAETKRRRGLPKLDGEALLGASGLWARGMCH
jgi:hypothetical protein